LLLTSVTLLGEFPDTIRSSVAKHGYGRRLDPFHREQRIPEARTL
jgi:hypothetical protein